MLGLRIRTAPTIRNIQLRKICQPEPLHEDGRKNQRKTNKDQRPVVNSDTQGVFQRPGSIFEAKKTVQAAIRKPFFGAGTSLRAPESRNW